MRVFYAFVRLSMFLRRYADLKYEASSHESLLELFFDCLVLYDSFGVEGDR